MAGAGALLGDISVRYPRDLLALFVGHQIDFFRGDAVNLRDRIGRALTAWGDQDPQSGFLHGMYAFGLEECNQYGQSAEAGQRAVELNPDDVWGIHAVVHTYEMQGQVPAGVRFMRERRSDWSEGNFLNVHNSWHYALYLLQAGNTRGALAVYDQFLHHGGSEDIALELLDATALLWRLWLEGIPAGDRWRPLAEAWARLLAPGFYPFNDMHAIMAFIGNGELGRAWEVVAALERVVRAGTARRRPAGDDRLGDDLDGGAAGVPQPCALRCRAVRAGARGTAAHPHADPRVRRQPRPARRRGADPAGGGDPRRAHGSRQRTGERAALGQGVQHLRLVEAGVPARRGR